MANIPGANDVNPGVYTDIQTASRGVSLPGGSRLAAFVGEGSTDETLVSQANGKGKDGFNPTYTSTSTGTDGRHFMLSNYPVVSNRTKLYKNGIPLVGLETIIDSSPFSSRYDYRIDIETGKIELQTAQLVDQGGAFYVPLSSNVGVGTLSSLTLIDQNAVPETWTIRCVGVQRNSSNDPLDKTAKFLAFGSVSGSKLDANGNPFIWVADGYTVSNGTISFAINETQVSNVSVKPFREGDAFTIKVKSGVLGRGDSLTANTIPVANINDPVLLQGFGDVVRRHGSPSVDNTLSLGAQLAFANSAPALITVQAAPSMPRRVSYILTESLNTLTPSDDDFIFPLPVGVTPDANSNIHFFITNNITNVEQQILPNKLDFYTLGTSGYPTVNQFIQDNTQAPGGYSYFYTVIEEDAVIASGFDGYIGRDLGFDNRGVFSSSTQFDSSYVGKVLKIIDATNVANVNTYTISSVSGGKLYAIGDTFSDFVTQTGTTFQVIDKATNTVISGYSGTDGVLTANVGLATATLTSVAVDFTTLTSPTTRRIKINGSTSGNNGLYDVTTYNSGTDTLTIKKVVVNESDLRYEIVDSNDVSNFVVINKNVVPSGYGLRVSLVDYKEADFYDAGWINALASLEVVECDIVATFPKQTPSVIFQNALAHCRAMSTIANLKERVLICGAIKGLKPENVLGTAEAAVEDIGILEGIQGENITDILAGNVEDLANYSVPNAFGSTYRCIYAYPDEIVVQAGADRVVMDGFYIAGAIAGRLSADPKIENPLTNKVIAGFTIPRTKNYSPLTLRQLSQAGICTLQPVAGGGKVVWGRTTAQSGYVEEQEASIVFIRDRVAKILRGGFASYIGEPESDDTQSALTTRAYIILNALTSQKLLTRFKDLVVQQDPVDSTQWNISVRVQPRYAINFIFISVKVGRLD